MVVISSIISCIILFCGAVFGLVELPQVEENNIASTEAAIRETINTLFSVLHLREVKKKPKLKEYSVVHNHLISFTLQDYNNLKQIAKLSRADKSKTSNETLRFMTALNDLLDEDVGIENQDVDSPDGSVTKYIELFLSKLEALKADHGVKSENMRISEEVYKILEKSDLSLTLNGSDISGSDEDSILGDSYWRPEGSRRIFEGKRTRIKYFPFMASIQLFNQFHCGGSIIKSDLVITAASCLQLAYNNRFFRENPAFLSIRVGSKFYNSGESISVLEVYFYPEYNPRNLNNNICLLRLTRRLNFKKKKVKRINFDKYASTLPLTTDGITIIGWGARGSSNVMLNPWQHTLSYAVLDVYPNQDCQEVYSKDYVTNRNFCAGFISKGGGACNRDVGDPGVANNILVGIVSFGSPVCGTPDAPTVFTKIGYYNDWIEEIMEQKLPRANARSTRPPKKPVLEEHVYEPYVPTTFRIPPLGKITPVPMSQIDAVRMLRNAKLFKEFMETMFGSKELLLYNALLGETATPITAPEETKKKHERIEFNSREFGSYVEHRTTMGIVDTITPASVEDDADEGEDENELAQPIDMANVEEDQPEMSQTTGIEISNKVIDRKTEFEKNLVNLIDNIDLKEIIDNLSSPEEETVLDVLENPKFFDLLQDKKVNENLTNPDDPVLALLYLSDTEKAKDNGTNIGLSMTDGGQEDMSEKEGDGLSIAAESFRDLTRSKNDSMLLNFLSQEELYTLLSEAIGNNTLRH